MFVENFDEMYAKITEVRERGVQAGLGDWNTPWENDLFIDEFNMQAILLIQNSIDRLRELGVPDDVMMFTVAELAVLSKMSDFDIKIRWVKNDITLTT